MNNKQIASKFDLLAKLMELHEENPFKIRSYANAYLSLRKLEGDLHAMPKSELSAIKGVGNTIADKIEEILQTGQLNALIKYQDMTPAGVQEMLHIKGLGPSKVRQIWREMDINTVGELLYACNENRLVAYKGFGIKNQEEIRQRIEYYLDSQGKYLYAHVYKAAYDLKNAISAVIPESKIEVCGDIRRCMPEVSGIELITDCQDIDIIADIEDIKEDAGQWFYKGFPTKIYQVSPSEFTKTLFSKSCSESFLNAFTAEDLEVGDEQQIFKNKGNHFIPSEHREDPDILLQYINTIPALIETSDIYGIIHNHSTYSDGLHSLEEMANFVKECGFQYFVISDHSKSAGYAGGLSEERVMQQWSEIDQLNDKFADGFKIYKSIESDILVDGSLDYSDDILKRFDLVIASVHSVLNMDIDKATARLIKAIEHPSTRILGHPSGRLLLARQGYPLDYTKIIDACASNHVVIELNANPQRLDLDWMWIPYALKKGVMISINPDAHSKESIHYIKYGVAVARKGGLTKDMCLNSLSRLEFDDWLASK
ncbi:MAG: helix-hairpin-helix domain-containing protein [Saprospiraceae bacterium]